MWVGGGCRFSAALKEGEEEGSFAGRSLRDRKNRIDKHKLLGDLPQEGRAAQKIR